MSDEELAAAALLSAEIRFYHLEAALRSLAARDAVSVMTSYNAGVTMHLRREVGQAMTHESTREVLMAALSSGRGGGGVRGGGDGGGGGAPRGGAAREVAHAVGGWLSGWTWLTDLAAQDRLTHTHSQSAARSVIRHTVSHPHHVVCVTTINVNSGPGGGGGDGAELIGGGASGGGVVNALSDRVVSSDEGNDDLIVDALSGSARPNTQTVMVADTR